MALDGSQSFAKVIEEHLELKRRNATLEGDMPIDRYRIDDPFENHPLFKSEEQARLEETLTGTEPMARRRRWCSPGLPPTRRDPNIGAEAQPSVRGHPLGPLARVRLGRLKPPRDIVVVRRGRSDPAPPRFYAQALAFSHCRSTLVSIPVAVSVTFVKNV